MSSRNPSPLHERMLDRDDDLGSFLEFLLLRANRRQMWLLFLDDRRRLGDPIMPMDDYPENPDGLVSTDDLGELPHARLLMHRAEMCRELTNNAAIVLVWERLGPCPIDENTRAWASAMAEAARDIGVPLRAQFLLHDGGIRQVHPDDYVS
ncbi:hypothetical protein [Humibacter antri]